MLSHSACGLLSAAMWVCTLEHVHVMLEHVMFQPCECFSRCRHIAGDANVETTVW